MKRVYSSLNSLLVDNLYNVLQQQGIDCEVRNRHGGSIVGEIPVSEAFTELWVGDEDRVSATALIESALRENEPAEVGSWTCPQCGTEIEGTFETCWHCASAGGDRDRPDDAEPIIDIAEATVAPALRYLPWIALLLFGLWRLSAG